MSASEVDLIKKEGWEIREETLRDDAGRSIVRHHVLAYGQQFPVCHPFQIYAKLYRNETNPELKYQFMKAMHDYLWPNTVWHYWTERRFKAHCASYSYISKAGGASTAKSYDVAKIAILFWLGDPNHRAVVVASTSLDSLDSRIWGYILKLLSKAALPIPYDVRFSKPPKILNPCANKKAQDLHHGMFAVAAKKGDDETAISNWIGRHPDKGLMLVLDEGTDMPPALLNALPNLEGNQEVFQCIIIGNSNSRFDLHGAMSTPKGGWKSIDSKIHTQWETTQKNGICLFFGAYESPAIHETDPERKVLLSKFLITAEGINEKAAQFGEKSSKFLRFVIGFWPEDTSDEVVISEQFLDTFHDQSPPEWSGIHPLALVGGLDPAFSAGGDDCILRFGILGITSSGLHVLDFQNQKLLFKLAIINHPEKTAEIQIAEQTNQIMDNLRCSLGDLAIDSNGQGRAIGSVIRLHKRTHIEPIKIYSTQVGGKRVKSFDIQVRTSLELWYAFRDFMQNGQIRGLDNMTLFQFSSRLVTTDPKTRKQVLESKLEYKKRMGAVMPSLARSPDHADAAALVLQAAIIKRGFFAGKRTHIEQATTFEDSKMRIAKEIYRQQQEIKSQAPPPIPVARFSRGIESLVKKKRSGFSQFD